MDIKAKINRGLSMAKRFFLPCEENGFRAAIFTGNFLLFFLIGVAILKLGFALFLFTFSKSPFYADVTKTALVKLANAERAKNSLPELAPNPVLDQAAFLKAQDMAKNGYFNHISPSGVNPWYWFRQAGYDYKYAGENLAIGFLDSGEVQNAWIASPTHKANIVNSRYKEIGIAVLKASFQGNPATIVVQLFGTRPNKTAQKIAPANLPAATFIPATTTASAAGQKNVLGASTQTGALDPLAAGLAAFLATGIYDVMQFMIYGSLFAVVLLLLANFALKADFDHADLLAKAAGFIAIMAVFALLDGGLIAALIPRRL